MLQPKGDKIQSLTHNSSSIIAHWQHWRANCCYDTLQQWLIKSKNVHVSCRWFRSRLVCVHQVPEFVWERTETTTKLGRSLVIWSAPGFTVTCSHPNIRSRPTARNKFRFKADQMWIDSKFSLLKIALFSVTLIILQKCNNKKIYSICFSFVFMPS